jgi:hypothetical protein
MAKTRIRLVRENVRKELLRSEEIARVTERIARQVNSSAGGHYTVERKNHQNRITFEVRDRRPGSFFREANNGDLARALRGFR